MSQFDPAQCDPNLARLIDKLVDNPDITKVRISSGVPARRTIKIELNEYAFMAVVFAALALIAVVAILVKAR